MNDMKNGVAIIDVNENESKAIFFDREVVEFAKLSASIKKNRKKADNKRKYEERKRKKEEREKQEIQNKMIKWRVYTVKTFCSIVYYVAIISVVALTMIAKLVSPLVAIPVMAYSLGVSCLKFGTWYGRAISKYDRINSKGKTN